MKTLIAIILLFTMISCESNLGCGIVVGGDSTTERSYLKVDFGNRTRMVGVDHKTYESFDIGDTICFD